MKSKKKSKWRVGLWDLICLMPLILLAVAVHQYNQVRELNEDLSILKSQTQVLKEQLQHSRGGIEELERAKQDQEALNNQVTTEQLEMIAKVIYREARGIPNKDHKAAVVWCILNRVDDPRFGNTIEEVITYPNAFAWEENTPVDEELLAIAADVCERWCLEKEGHTEVGRVLPSTYCFFTGDGVLNHFTEEWPGRVDWDWSLSSPY